MGYQAFLVANEATVTGELLQASQLGSFVWPEVSQSSKQPALCVVGMALGTCPVALPAVETSPAIDRRTTVFRIQNRHLAG